jgi:hypothetical protein
MHRGISRLLFVKDRKVVAMTDEQFQREVHDYKTADRRVALLDAMKYQDAGVDAVAVDFGGLGYGLMLARSAVFMGLPIVSTRLATGDTRLTAPEAGSGDSDVSTESSLQPESKSVLAAPNQNME